MTERTMKCPEWATAVAVNAYLSDRVFWVGRKGYSVINDQESDKFTPFGKDVLKQDNFKLLCGISGDKTMPDKKPEDEEVKTSAYHRLMQSQFPPVYDDKGEFLGIMVDFYDVALAFDPENRTAPEDHALKKLILPGKRGVKDVLKDLGEVIWSLQAGIRIRVAEKRKQDFNSKK